MHPSVCTCRCHHRGCLNRRAQRAGRPNVRRLGSPGPPVFPDPPDGPDGPKGWHLEAVRVGGLRSQTGKSNKNSYSSLYVLGSRGQNKKAQEWSINAFNVVQ